MKILLMMIKFLSFNSQKGYFLILFPRTTRKQGCLSWSYMYNPGMLFIKLPNVYGQGA